MIAFFTPKDIGNLYLFLFDISMISTTVAQIFADHQKFLDQELVVKGRIKSVRDSKTFGFIELND
jgi:hypothetical protein